MYSFKKLEEKIDGAIRKFESEIAALRAGRANPILLEGIKIEAYGAETPIKNLASITAENAKTLIIQPWDKSFLEAIEKAIAASNIGIKPITQKDFIRAILPDLTEERRDALIKVLGKAMEEARISLRKGRDDVWKEIQEKERGGEISEDEKFRLKNQMEEKAKKGADKLEELAERKKREISE